MGRDHRKLKVFAMADQLVRALEGLIRSLDPRS